MGGGRLGSELSHPCDANIYLIHDGGDGVLIDAGCGLGTSDVLANLRHIAPAVQISGIIVTHAHADHAAGAQSLSAQTGAAVYASAHVASVLDGTRPAGSGLDWARAKGLYPPEVAFSPIAPALVDDGYRLSVGRVRVELSLTEGHADGHLTAIVREPDGAISACTGDLIFSRGRAALLDDFDETDVGRWEVSVRRVAGFAPDRMFPGHGMPVLRRAGEHLAVALDALDSGYEPPRLIDSNLRPRRDRQR